MRACREDVDLIVLRSSRRSALSLDLIVLRSSRRSALSLDGAVAQRLPNLLQLVQEPGSVRSRKSERPRAALDFRRQGGCREVLEELPEPPDFRLVGMRVGGGEDRRYRSEVRQHEAQNVRRMAEGISIEDILQDFASRIEIERIRGRTQCLPPIRDALDGTRHEIVLPTLPPLIQVGVILLGPESELIDQIRRWRLRVGREERGELEVVRGEVEVDRGAGNAIEGKPQGACHSTSLASRLFFRMRSYTICAVSLMSSAMSSND